MEIEGLKVVHALPGRVRLKVAKVKGNPTMARKVEAKLAKVPGIKQVEAKSGTGSLLIHYDMEHLYSMASLEVLAATLGELFPEIEAVTLGAWLASLAENPAPAPAPGGGSGSGITRGVVGSFAALNSEVRQFTGGLDLKLLAPLTLIFLGLRGLWASEKVTFPSWSDYLWFGFSSLVLLNRGLVEGNAATPAAKPE